MLLNKSINPDLLNRYKQVNSQFCVKQVFDECLNEKKL